MYHSHFLSIILSFYYGLWLPQRGSLYLIPSFVSFRLSCCLLSPYLSFTSLLDQILKQKIRFKDRLLPLISSRDPYNYLLLLEDIFAVIYLSLSLSFYLYLYPYIYQLKTKRRIDMFRGHRQTDTILRIKIKRKGNQFIPILIIIILHIAKCQTASLLFSSYPLLSYPILSSYYHYYYYYW